MKFLITLIVFSCGFVLQGRAQQNSGLFDPELYRHTLNHSEYKATFYTQPAEHKPFTADPEKTYFWYSNNQVNTTQGGYSGKLLDGLYEAYYLTKNLKEKGFFKAGLKNGAWSSWSESGKLSQIMRYQSGVLQGSFSNYNEAGMLVETGNYREGKLHGNFTRYNGRDSAMVIRYHNGMPAVKKSWKGLGWVKKWFKKNEQNKRPGSVKG